MTSWFNEVCEALFVVCIVEIGLRLQTRNWMKFNVRSASYTLGWNHLPRNCMYVMLHIFSLFIISVKHCMNAILICFENVWKETQYFSFHLGILPTGWKPICNPKFSNQILVAHFNNICSFFWSATWQLYTPLLLLVLKGAVCLTSHVMESTYRG